MSPKADIQDSIKAAEARDDALALLEEARGEYLVLARETAVRIATEGDGTCTVDQVRELCPPPLQFDGRVMGAIFKMASWELESYINSKRVTCHKRPIARFRYLG